jgi:predicted N-acyltransferase
MSLSHLSFTWSRGLQDISPAAWQTLARQHPMLDYRFLHAFESSASVDHESGWIPYHLTVRDGGLLVAAAPCYIKTHSYGEYVFDWSWADAYQQAGGTYYPKLISAIPFSPVAGPRLLVHPYFAEPEHLAAEMLQHMRKMCEEHGLSGTHILFPDVLSANYCAAQGLLRREGVQFRWENQGYADWDAFLAVLSHDKRKKIRQERNKVAQHGVTCRVLNGNQLTEADLILFYQCYSNTYHRHGSQPYLTFAFFEEITRNMPDNVLLFIATQAGEDIAVSLCIQGGGTLYGRYWGSLRDVSCLHFELCYYQPQAFCITQGIRYFEGGAQGVHKLARGFVPYTTCSYHWLAHEEFHQSVARFLSREETAMQHYVDELEERSPYKAVPEST